AGRVRLRSSHERARRRAGHGVREEEAAATCVMAALVAAIQRACRGLMRSSFRVLEIFPVSGSVRIALARRRLLAYLHGGDWMDFPKREPLGLTFQRMLRIVVGKVKIVVE